MQSLRLCPKQSPAIWIKSESQNSFLVTGVYYMALPKKKKKKAKQPYTPHEKNPKQNPIKNKKPKTNQRL